KLRREGTEVLRQLLARHSIERRGIECVGDVLRVVVQVPTQIKQIAPGKRCATVEGVDGGNLPPAHYAVQHRVHVASELFPFADRQLVEPAHHQAVGTVVSGDAFFESIGAPVQVTHPLHEAGVVVVHHHYQTLGETLLQLDVQRVIV